MCLGVEEAVALSLCALLQDLMRRLHVEETLAMLEAATTYCIPRMMFLAASAGLCSKDFTNRI